jgi:hypothetical protein
MGEVVHRGAALKFGRFGIKYGRKQKANSCLLAFARMPSAEARG